MWKNWIEKIFKLIGLKKKVEQTSVQQEIAVIEIAPREIETTQIEEKTLNNNKVTSYQTPLKYPVGIKTEVEIPVIYVEVTRDDKGAVEDYFFDSIRERFDDKIKNNVCIVLPDFDVTPDLAYIDLEKNLFIAIEIDEPYTINNEGNLIPIHYKGLDDERNKALLANGWSIIRFAESQVVFSTKQCDRFISSFLYNEQSQEEELVTVPTWTQEDALKMIEDKFRNTYLPFEFQQGIRGNSKFTYRRFKVDTLGEMVSKKGDKFVVLRLYLYNKYLGNYFEIVGYHQCWIPEEKFWKIFSETEVGKIINNDFQKVKDKSWESGGMFIAPAYFEAIGYSNGRYFNLLDESKFKIVHLEQVVELAQRYGTSKTYKQIADEFLKNHKNASKP